MRQKAESLLGMLLFWTLISTTLLVTPFWSIDPINPIKMLSVTVASFIGLGVLLASRKVFDLKPYKIALVLISGFAAWLLVVFLVSGGERLQQLFGTSGRNTGLITYFAFSVLFVISMVVSRSHFFTKFLWASLVVSASSVIYGVVQAADADPINWINPYSPVLGFVGNPNFQSSLLGVLGTVIFTQLLSNGGRFHLKIFYVALLLLSLYVIAETNSQQGFLVLLIGSTFSMGLFIYQKNRTLGYSYFGLAFVGFIAVLVGTLNKGPLASLLYKESVTYRGDYWNAGWKMTLENPIFGVGLDSYGDWYRRSRSIDATLRRGPDVTSNAAHNVFLDISSYGGFPLVLLYIALMTLVVISAGKVIKRSHNFNAGFVAMFAGWVAFQAQSIISINQIGLALWGWVLSGLIIGYEINTRGDEVIVEKKSGRITTKPVQAPASTALAMFVGLICGLIAGLPPYLASAEYKTSLQSGNPQTIQEAAYIWPLDASRMIQISTILNENNLNAQALKVAVDASKSFPDNFEVWARLSAMNSVSEKQKAEAFSQMKRLDPLNPNLK